MSPTPEPSDDELIAEARNLLPLETIEYDERDDYIEHLCRRLERMAGVATHTTVSWEQPYQDGYAAGQTDARKYMSNPPPEREALAVAIYYATYKYLTQEPIPWTELDPDGWERKLIDDTYRVTDAVLALLVPTSKENETP